MVSSIPDDFPRREQIDPCSFFLHTHPDFHSLSSFTYLAIGKVWRHTQRNRNRHRAEHCSNRIVRQPRKEQKAEFVLHTHTHPLLCFPPNLSLTWPLVSVASHTGAERNRTLLVLYCPTTTPGKSRQNSSRTHTHTHTPSFLPSSRERSMRESPPSAERSECPMGKNQKEGMHTGPLPPDTHQAG